MNLDDDPEIVNPYRNPDLPAAKPVVVESVAKALPQPTLRQPEIAKSPSGCMTPIAIVIAGVIIGGSYTDVNLSNLIIQDTNFNNNGGVGPAVRGDGDIVAFFYNGDATLKNIIINNDGAAAGIEPDYGIQFRGRADTAAWPPVNPAAMGTVSFDNVKVAGDYRAAQIGIQGMVNKSICFYIFSTALMIAC